jgi:DNA-binding NtrC family response regulator
MSFNYGLEIRLRKWAVWVLKIADGSLGFPTEAVIACFSKYGFIPSTLAKTSPNPLNSPKEEEVNTVINQMSQQFPQYSVALYNTYLAKGKHSEIAKQMGISARTLRERVQKAKIWMSGRL